MEAEEKKSNNLNSDLRERIKILIVAPALPLVGGQAVQAARLVEHLEKEDSVKVKLQPINPQFLTRLHKIKYLRTIVVSIAYIFQLFRNIPEHDVIHIYSSGDTGFLISTIPAILVTKIFGKKNILNYKHGGAEQHLKNWRRTAIPIVKLFDKIVVPSGFLVDVFAKFGFSAEVIHNFVNTEKYKFRKRTKIRPVFLSNRNFDELYNVGCILRAFSIIQKRFPEAQLIVAGDGEEKEKLHALAKELKLKNVEFLGRVAQDEMPELYNRADIYLNSPNIDNMPNSIIEAFSAGTPVVSTNAGGIPYIVEHGRTGLLVEIGDDKSLADEAIKLLENEDLAQNITIAAHAESVKYTWKQVRDSWLKIYSELFKPEKDNQISGVDKL